MFQKTLEHTIDAFPELALPYLISPMPNDHYAPVIIRSVKSVPLFQKAKNGERIERWGEKERGAKVASHSRFSFFPFVMPTFRSEECYKVAQLGLDFT